MIYARIASGVVAEMFTPPSNTPMAELFHPSLTWVACGDTPSVAPGWTYSAGSFHAPPAPPAPTLIEQAMAALGRPIEVVCTSVPALNSGYTIDAAAQAQITSIAAAINAGLGLPGGGSTFNFPDAAGVQHAWPAAQFMDFAKAVMNYVYALGQVARGVSASLPTQPVTIS